MVYIYSVILKLLISLVLSAIVACSLSSILCHMMYTESNLVDVHLCVQWLTGKVVCCSFLPVAVQFRY